MYHEFYGLSTAPFHITPDPYFFFPSSSHKEAFAALLYGLQNRKGFIVLTGEVGSGKTTVLRSFLEAGRSTKLGSLFKGIDTSKIKTVFVFNPDISFKNLLRNIYGELGIPLPSLQSDYVATEKSDSGHGGAGLSEEQIVFELVQHLHSELIKEYQAGNQIVLLIDEAQNMPIKTLENLRMLSNLETTRDKLLQIFLIGQPELEHVLQKHQLRQLKQRIAIRAKLSPLNRQDTVAYIEHRLHRAGAQSSDLFSRSALRAVHKYAQGIPRRINTVCDNALIASFAAGHAKVGVKDVQTAIADIEGSSGRKWRQRLATAAAVVAAVLITAWFAPLPKTLQPLSHVFQHVESTVTDEPSDSQASVDEQAAAKAPEQMSPMGATQSESQSNSFSVSEEIHFPDGLFQEQTGNGAAQKQQSGKPEQTGQGTADDTSESGSAGQTTSPASNPLDVFPSSEEEKRLDAALNERIPFYSELSRARRFVLVEMAKQVSVSGLMTFQLMLDALEEKDYIEASRQMILSTWEMRVGGHAYELAKIMRTGEVQTSQK